MKTFMVIAIIAALAAVGGSIFMGVRSFDGTVTENPYEKGLLWDDMRNQKSKLGWKVMLDDTKFKIGDNEVIASIMDRNGMPLDIDLISIIRSRPSSAAYDGTFDTIQLKDGYYRAKVNFPLYGYWDVKVNVTHDDINFSYVKKIFVEKGEKGSKSE